jgi:hypothetical protein
VLAVVVTTCSCVALGLLIGSIGLRARDVFFGANLVYFTMLLVCGVNVANDALPGWLGAIGRCLPLTHGIEARGSPQARRSDVAGLRRPALTLARAPVAHGLFRFFELEAGARPHGHVLTDASDSGPGEMPAPRAAGTYGSATPFCGRGTPCPSGTPSEEELLPGVHQVSARETIMRSLTLHAGRWRSLSGRGVLYSTWISQGCLIEGSTAVTSRARRAPSSIISGRAALRCGRSGRAPA